jgi:hypothetical protein
MAKAKSKTDPIQSQVRATIKPNLPEPGEGPL